MEKKEALACERGHGDRHTPPLSSSWGQQHSLSAAYCRERIHSNVHAGTVCYFISQVWTRSADFPGCGDGLEGIMFSMLGVCFVIKKKKSSFVIPGAVYFKVHLPHKVHFHSAGSF